MNKYLEKIAKWYSPGKIIGNITGKHKRIAQRKLNNAHEFNTLAHELGGNNAALSELARRSTTADKDTFKARVAAGIGATVAVGAGAYGYKKVRDRQNAETQRLYGDILNLNVKQAALGGAAKSLASEAGSAIGGVLKTIGRRTTEMMNSAGGGKIKDYGERHGVKKTNEFYAKSIKEQAKHIMRNQGVNKTNTNPNLRKQIRKEHVRTLGALHDGRLNARIALGSSAAAGISAYGWKKNRDAAKKNNPYM